MPERVTITARSGRVEVVAGAFDGITVEGGSLSHTPDGAVIEGVSSRLRVDCPALTDVTIATASGRVTTRGPLGEVHVTSQSGVVEVEQGTDIEVRTMSGRIEVGRCDGPCRCIATSGSVQIGRAGRAEVATASGRVAIAEVGDADVTAASGRVELASARGAHVRVRAHSGAVTVDLPADARPRTALSSRSGRVRCEAASGDDGTLDIETATGSIEVRCRR